ncbi:MAG TPA: ABC transporter permease subunit [Acidimicrobiales bacterium]|nr:ABC transporter permease subunit [Acidimicrobiales bacterium]
MISLIRAELLKLRTTRVFLGLCGATVLFTVLGVVAGVLSAGSSGSPKLGTAASARNIFGSGGPAALFALVLGILSVTGELRHGTITQTFLVTPRRTLVVAAKLVAMLIAGTALGVLAGVVTTAVAWPWLAAKDVSVSLVSSDVGPVLAAVVVGAALFGVIGVGVGALIRNQIAAVVVALVWEFVLEAILIGVVPDVGRWLPGGAARGLTRETLSSGNLLPAWGAGLVLLAYGLAFAAAGSHLLVRRDVT